MQATFTQGSLSVAVRFQDAPEECGIRNAELDLIRNAECGMRNYLSARVLHILNISVTRLLLNLRSGQDLTLQKSVLRIITGGQYANQTFSINKTYVPARNDAPLQKRLYYYKFSKGALPAAWRQRHAAAWRQVDKGVGNMLILNRKNA